MIQTLYNPRTRELRNVDITSGTSGIATLYQQGWRAPTPDDYRTIQGQAMPRITYQGPYTPPAPPPQAPPPQYADPPPAFRDFTRDGMVDLVQIAQSNNRDAQQEAMRLYGHRYEVAELAAKVPATKEQYDKMGSGAQKSIRIVEPVSLDEWNLHLGRNDTEWLLKHYPEARGVTETQAAKLGVGVIGRTAFVSPTVLEKLTFWNELKNEKPTIGGFAQEITDVVIPFKSTIRHWDKLSNWERGGYLALDLLFVGAIAGKPAYNLTKKGANAILDSTITQKGRKVIVNELNRLQAAATSGDPLKVRAAGHRLRYIAGEIRPKSPALALALHDEGNIAIRNAGAIAEGTYQGTGHLRRFRRNVKNFVRDESGEIGRYRVRSAREIAIEQARVAGAEATKRELGTKTARVATRVAERPVIDFGTGERGFWKKVADDLVKHGDDIAKGKRTRDMTRKDLIEEAKHTIRDKPRPRADDPRRRPHPSQEVRERARYEWEESLKRIKARNPDSKATDELLAEIDKMNAAEIVKQARENEAKIYKMAEEKLAELERMRISKLDIVLPNLKSVDLIALVALDPAALLKLSALTSYQSQLKLRARLQNLADQKQSQAIAWAIAQGETKGLTKSETKALAQLKNNTQAQVRAIALTRLDLKLSDDTRQQLKREVITDLVPEPLTKMITPPITDTTPRIDEPPRKKPPEKTPPDKPPPKKKRPPPGMPFEPVILDVQGIPERPGVVVLPQGVVDWRIKPPYRKGEQDIKPVPRKVPAEGEGSPQAGLRVMGGSAPEKLTLQLSSKVAVDILRGRRLKYRKPRGPYMIDTAGKKVRPRRGTLLT